MALILFFMITYTVSYMTRVNYAAVISEIVRSEGISESLLSISLVGNFITYGTGQILSGFFGDRISPKRLVQLGLSVTTLMNLMIPICHGPYQMALVWWINGFAQAFMWPPLVKLMLLTLSDKEYNTAALVVPCGGSVGSVIVYLVSPLLISLAGWRAVFVFSAVFGAVMTVLWSIICQNVTPAPSLPGDKTVAKSSVPLITPLIGAVMFAIVLQGMLRDGVTTWMPTYVSETYSLGSEIAILTGVMLPIFAIIFSSLTSVVHKRFLKHPLVCAGAVFSLGGMAAGMIWLFVDASPVISVAMFALLTGCMHGTNLLLVCILPKYFKKHGNVSTMSGILNSSTYVGSAISTYGIAALSQSLGWSFTVLIWVAIAFLGAGISFMSAKAWTVKYGKE